MTVRQRSDSIGRTILQTVAQLATFDAKSYQLRSVASLSRWASTLFVCSTFAVLQRVARVCQRQLILEEILRWLSARLLQKWLVVYAYSSAATLVRLCILLLSAQALRPDSLFFLYKTLRWKTAVKFPRGTWQRFSIASASSATMFHSQSIPYPMTCVAV